MLDSTSQGSPGFSLPSNSRPSLSLLQWFRTPDSDPHGCKKLKKNSSIIGKNKTKLCGNWGLWVTKTKLRIKQSNLENLILYPHSLFGQTRFAALSFDLGLPYLPRLAAVLVLELGYCLGNSQESQLPLKLIDIKCWWLFFVGEDYDYDISSKTTR